MGSDVFLRESVESAVKELRVARMQFRALARSRRSEIKSLRAHNVSLRAENLTLRKQLKEATSFLEVAV